MKGSPASPPDPEDAIARAREAAFLNPNDAGAQARLGRACLAAGKLALAIEALQRAVRIEPENASVRADLGRAWLAAAEPEKALLHLRLAVNLDSADATDARALLAVAESGGQGLAPVFIRNLFDQYAERYDSEMQGVLAYRAPEALRDLVRRVVTPLGVHSHDAPAGGLDVLDLGCGTGLAGQAFRAFARTLVGVDLSPRMVEKARARGIYDRVLVGEMVSALHEAAAFDLVLAVDALGYLGDLAPVFRAARGALRPGGRFAATVEESAGADFVLGPARRFRHGADYVRREALAAGFDVLALENTELRRDRGQPVAGLAFVLGPQGYGENRGETIQSGPCPRD